MEKYFGTDGIRGIFGEEVDETLAYNVGKALAKYFGKGSYFVAKDTRCSGENLACSILEALEQSGCNVVYGGILPTAAVATAVPKFKYKCGIMITASHNPPNYNGIKIFDKDGYKLNSETEEKLEKLINSFNIKINEKNKLNKQCDWQAREYYIDKIVNACKFNFEGLKICVDCGYGASQTVIKDILSRLNIKAYIHNDKPDGNKINIDCGALHAKYILYQSKLKNVDLAFSFDGDADRLSVVYKGEIIDGNIILYNLAKILNTPYVVSTIIANIGLEKKLKEENKTLLRTNVGDKYVSELMKGRYLLGGEPSGHYLFGGLSTTGDGILAALMILKTIITYGELEKFDLAPQKMISIPCKREILNDVELLNHLNEWNKILENRGRVLLRYSGTEPKVRVMAESDNKNEVELILKDITDLINKLIQK